MSILSLLLNVLFVGHSLVGPTLPGLVEAGLNAQGTPAQVQAQVINGASLKFNWEHSAEAEGVDARAVLAATGTDVLILTEAQPLATNLQWNDTAAQVAAFAAAARATNPEARVFVYETWPSLNSGPGADVSGDAEAATPWRDRLAADLPKWEGIARTASRAVPGVGLIPAGQAMGRLADAAAAGQVPGAASIRDFFVDDIHPNPRGLYFLAMVQIGAISGKSPEGLPAKLTRSWQSRDAVISDPLAAALQRIAWEAVSGYRMAAAPDAEPGAADPAASDPGPTLVSAPAPLPVATAFTPITNPALAFNLSGVNDWSVEQPFLDVMKTARPWTGHLPGQWGGWGHDDLARGGWLDPKGWLTAVPPDLSGVSTLFLTDLPPDAGGMAGRYVLTYAGRGAMALSGRAKNVVDAPGRMTFDFTPGEGAVILTLTATDPADPIRDIVVVREDRAAALAAGAIFNPDWLNRLRGVKGLRFMDWMAVSDSTLARAEDRPKPDDYTWARNGVPVEVMLALANELKADPWFCMPHLAEDGLVRAYAEAVKAGLDPGLVASVEYSNEVWNWQFTQARWAEDQGKARWGKEATWVQFYALRAAEIADIWAQVFGPDAPARLQRIIATQTGWIGLEDQILDAPLVVAEGRRPPYQSFDAYAVTGYFAAIIGSDGKDAMLSGWLAESAAAAAQGADAAGLTGAARDAWIAAHRHDLATARVAEEVADGRHSGDPEDTLATLTGSVWPHHAAVAAAHGLKLVMYEGGTHVVGYGAQVDNAEKTAFFTHFNYTPEMGALYATAMAEWAKLTPAPFTAFSDVYAPGKWGSWGALRHLGDENPRWAALAKGCAAC